MGDLTLEEAAALYRERHQRYSQLCATCREAAEAYKLAQQAQEEGAADLLNAQMMLGRAAERGP